MMSSRPRTWSYRGFPEQTLSVKIYILAGKTCLIYAFVTQQPLGIPSRNLGICIFVASTISIFNHIVVSALCFGCTAAIKCGNVCHRPHNNSLYSGSNHWEFNSPRLVKREAGFPNPRRVLIGSNQFWRVNDSPYYREYLNNDGLVHDAYLRRSTLSSLV